MRNVKKLLNVKRKNFITINLFWKQKSSNGKLFDNIKRKNRITLKFDNDKRKNYLNTSPGVRGTRVHKRFYRN